MSAWRWEEGGEVVGKAAWLIHDGTGSVEGSTGWYLMVLGQYGATLVRTWW